MKRQFFALALLTASALTVVAPKAAKPFVEEVVPVDAIAEDLQVISVAHGEAITAQCDQRLRQAAARLS